MRPEPNEARTRSGDRPKAARKAQLRRLALDALEPRTLLAQLPTPTFLDLQPAPSPVSVEGFGNNTILGDESSPSVVVSLNNPDKLVAVWTNTNDPRRVAPGPLTVAGAAFSIDGGETWNDFDIGGVLFDHSTTNPPVPFSRVTDTTVAIDRDDRVYILSSQHNDANNSGVLVLNTFSFSGNNPTRVGAANNVLHNWTTNAAHDPVVAVNTNPLSFTDPDPNAPNRTVTDPTAGNVYVSWATTDTIPALGGNPDFFNPNRIALIASSDGGQDFSPPVYLNSGGNGGLQRNAAPRVAVSQGSPERGIAPGTVTVVWDDFGTGGVLSGANPQFDLIEAETVSRGFAARASRFGVGINDNGSTPITINVPAAEVASFASLSDIDVRLAITHPNLDQLTIRLTSPTGLSVTLVNAATLTGADLGILNGNNLTTIFDDSASRNIFDNNNGANANANPYIDSYRPDAGSLAIFNGLSAAQLAGDWTLTIEDNAVNAGVFQQLEVATLALRSGITADTSSNAAVGTSFVLGGLDGIGRTAIGASARPIAPAPVIASDNTLGSFSPYQGRLYAAFVNYSHPTFFDAIAPLNPVDNTDIHLSVSDNGGLSWTPVRDHTDNPDTPNYDGPLNDDIARLDGFSEGTIVPGLGYFDGRSQFLPSIAVDQSTGTVVAGWYDGRHDAARARVATYIGASIDGGATFSPQTYANADRADVDPLDGSPLPDSAIDSITGRTLRLGPLPENLSVGNPLRDTTQGFGSRLGLAAGGGRAFPVWASNQNFAGIDQDGAGGSQLLDIVARQALLGAGPRVVDATMGPITPTIVTQLSDGAPLTLNSTRDVDGTPRFDGLVVTFDRPVYFNPSDPTAFGFDDVRIYFRDTTPGNTSGGQVPIDQIIPIYDPASPLQPIDQQRRYGASSYLVRTTPRAGVGTYSYQIGANYTDRIRNVGVAGNLVDQDADSTPGEAAVNLQGPGDVFAVPAPLSRGNDFQIQAGGPLNGLFLGPYATDSLPVVLYGPTVENVAVPGRPLNDPTVDPSLAPDRSVRALDVTFDRDIRAGSFTPGDILRVDGPAGPISGPFTVRPVYRNAQAMTITDDGQASFSDIVVPNDGGALMIGDLDVTVDIRHPRTRQLLIVLVAPPAAAGGDEIRITLAGDPNRTPNGGLGGEIGRDYRDTTFDQDEDTPIGDAVPPFTGRFRPFGDLDRLNDLPLFRGNGVYRLEVTDLATGGPVDTQSILSWSISVAPTAASLADPDVVARTFRVELPTAQQLSGTYAVTLASGITSARGAQLDADRDAGLDILRGVGPTAPVTVRSADVPKPIADATPGNPPAPSITNSTITITDDFLIQDLDLRLVINHPRVKDLTAVLITPANNRVTLFSPATLNVDGANFANTTFDDAAPTFVFQGANPYNGRYAPEDPLSDAYLDPNGNPRRSAGTYTLEITDARVGAVGTLVEWSLTLAKPLTGDGLGEQVADRERASFRIFNLDPANPEFGRNWTPVGPAAVDVQGIQNRWAGRVGAVAVDPADPTGNTVYVGGASGGVWRTTNFLTADPEGPTYVPLTDFGPDFSLQIGSITVFNDSGDPERSVILAATGEGDDAPGFGTNQTGRGLGFLRSTDGGRSWTLLSGPESAFVGLTAFKVVVDPTRTPDANPDADPANGIIIYAALSGVSDNQALPADARDGGLWKSIDGGNTWTKVSVDAVHGIRATDIVLDPYSVDVATGNLDRFYVAFPDAAGSSVYRATSQGENLRPLLGDIGKPLVQDPDFFDPPAIPVTPATADTPPAPGGRIVLAQVRPTGVPDQDISYQDWLYAAAVEAGTVVLYSTKDRGDNWTRIPLPVTPDEAPSNNPDNPTVDIGTGDGVPPTFAVSIAVDPNNPQVVYVGGNRGTNISNNYTLLRVDTSLVYDGNFLDFYNPERTDGVIAPAVGSPATPKDPRRGLPFIFDTFGNAVNQPRATNLVRNPATPFANASFFVQNVASFANDGGGARWTPFAQILQGADGVHDLLTIVDPISGKARLIAGTDQGVFSGVDDAGRIVTAIGDAALPAGTRNGNLQIAQIHYGAVQASTLVAQARDSLFFANSWQIGFPASNGDVPTNADIAWSERDGTFIRGSGTGVATAQVDNTDRGIAYKFQWPGDGGRLSDFFQVYNGAIGEGRTTGLIQAPDVRQDPQWWFGGVAPLVSGRDGAVIPGLRFGNFAVNPINNDQIIISSGAGRLFGTVDQGRTWREIGTPGSFVNDPNALPNGEGLLTYAPALAFGAPAQPGGNASSLDDFIYVGTAGGELFATRTGGGAAGTDWVPITGIINNDPNRANFSPILSIAASPDRGTSAAYVLTRRGVFYNGQTRTGNSFNGNWLNITNNLPAGADLRGIAVDWRYQLPADPADHDTDANFPILYVAARAGVFRSLDNGANWTSFPDNAAADGTPAADGYLPHTLVTDLDLSLGFVNPANGRLLQADSPNLLVASTFGRGQFALRLAPVVLDGSVGLDPNRPDGRGGSDSGLDPDDDPTDLTLRDRVTRIATPFIRGISEQSAFGNVVRVTLFDLTDPAKPRIVGGFDPDDPATDVPANYTDEDGRFSVQVNDGKFTTNDTYTIGVQTINLAGTRSEVARFEFTLDVTRPVTPGAPDLATSSDSAFPPTFTDTDDYTNDSTPTFNVANVEPGNVLFLFRGADKVRTIFNATPDPATGLVAIKDDGGQATPVAVPDGTYVYTVRQVDQAGNLNLADSGPLTVTIDTRPPAVPSAPTLLGDDDTGQQGDNLTGNNQPRITGNLALAPNEIDPANLPLVQLTNDANELLGQARVNPDGSYVIRLDEPLNDGPITLRVRAVDRAGNLGGASDGTTITIDTTEPNDGDITLMLSPLDDTGIVGDNVTSNRRPRLTGTVGVAGAADGNLAVQLIDLDGTITGIADGPIGPPVIAQPDGRYNVQFPTLLAEGVYRVATRVTDAAGNSADSPTLVLTIDLTGPAGAPDLRLDPDSDSGVKGDGRTSVRRPFLIGTTDPDAEVQIVGPTGDVLATGTADDQGAFSLRLASNLVNGTIALRSRSRDTTGNLGPFSNPFNLTIETTLGDYDADGTADLALFRPDLAANKGTFLVLRSTLDGESRDLGLPGDIPLSADFDGDGVNDYVVFRPNSLTLPGASEWLILGSRTGERSILFGGAGLDLPAPADYDGDGIADLAVFRPNSDLIPGASEWFILGSKAGPMRFQFGKAGDDVPVPADYDGDGKADLAVFRPDSDLVPGASQWFVSFSAGGAMSPAFGQGNLDLPVPADYDGDGRADVATYRPNTSQWFVLGSRGITQAFDFGAPGDLPAPADYDNDGKADLALYRAATSQWNYRASSTNASIAVAFGGPDDIPVLSPLAYRDQRPDTIVSPRTSASALGQNAADGAIGRAAPAASSFNAAPDLGASASRLAAGNGSGGTTAPTSRTRPAQAAAKQAAAPQLQQAEAPAPRRGVLGWLNRRRPGQA